MILYVSFIAAADGEKVEVTFYDNCPESKFRASIIKSIKIKLARVLLSIRTCTLFYFETHYAGKSCF